MSMMPLDAAPHAHEARVPLGFRMGVTGHRTLPDADMAALTGAVGHVLDQIATQIGRLAKLPEAGRLYRSGDPVMRLVSPLAEGADRIVARAAADRGWTLVAPLPFWREEYVKDFPETKAEFDALLALAAAHGEVVELDGRRTAAPNAYAEVGRFVLRHSDLLIAIWNGAPAAGVGGTGEIVEEARALGIPIVHIDAAAPHAIRLLSDEVIAVPFDGGALEGLLRTVVLPVWPTERRNHALAAEHHFAQERVRYTDVPPDFRYRGPFAMPQIWWGSLYPWLRRHLGAVAAAPSEVADMLPPLAPDNPTLRACYLHFQRADAMATHYANIHRSAFVAIYLLGALSLCAAFTAQFLRAFEPAARVATMVEAIALLSVLALFFAEKRRRWRERWLDYRTIAELLRQSDLMALIGGAPMTGCLDRLSDMHPERGWVFWFVGAVTRAVGVVGVRYDATYLARVRDYAIKTRFADQIDYHRRTTRRNARVNSTLRWGSNILFAATMVAIALEFAGLGTHDLPWPGWFAGVLPALSAASFGIRNQSEFEIVMHRSDRLRERLVWETERISRLAGDRLTSTTLGHALQGAARVMQADTVEWAAIFEVKESEPQ